MDAGSIKVTMRTLTIPHSHLLTMIPYLPGISVWESPPPDDGAIFVTQHAGNTPRFTGHLPTSPQWRSHPSLAASSPPYLAFQPLPSPAPHAQCVPHAYYPPHHASPFYYCQPFIVCFPGPLWVVWLPVLMLNPSIPSHILPLSLPWTLPPCIDPTLSIPPPGYYSRQF